jgi:hypothetical protein
MSPALADMVRGVAGAPEAMVLLRPVRSGLARWPAGSTIERVGDNHYLGNFRVTMAFLIFLARTGAIEDAAVVEGQQHAA